MKTVKCVQYVERFIDIQGAEECLYKLAFLEGFITGHFHKSPSIGESEDFVCQAFFECEEDVNPESVASVTGMRIVQAPINFLVNLANRKSP